MRFQREVGLEEPRKSFDIKLSVGFALLTIAGMGSLCFLPAILVGTSMEVFGLVFTLVTIVVVLLLNNAKFCSRLHIKLIAVSCWVVFLLLIGLGQYVGHFIWDQQCERGVSEACWKLAREHRAERDIGMRKCKAKYYEDRACELEHPLACESVLSRERTVVGDYCQ